MKRSVAFFAAVGMAFSPALAQPAPPSVANPLVRQLNDAFADVYEKVAPSVVVIEVQSTSDSTLNGLPEGLDMFFRGPNSRASRNTEIGSGFIISADGYILTNNHVVESATKGGITVKLKDGRKFSGELIGTDERADVAVIKIDAKDLPAAELGDSDKARVGQFAFAIGAPLELAYSFTAGIISAKGRSNLTRQSYEDYIQTDAAINPGNSGGPLCDIDGKVIGVNTLIAGIDRGLGFAIPIKLAGDVSHQLIASGHVSRPWLGINIMGIEESEELQAYFHDLQKGVVVRDVIPNTPAYASDLQNGDVILKVDGVPVSLAHDLQREILAKQIGQMVQLDVWRDGHLARVSVRTSEQPDRVIRASSHRPDAWMQKQSQPNASPHKDYGEYGMKVEDAPPGNGGKAGALVSDITDDGLAAASGLLANDVIVEAGGKPVRSKADFEAALSQSDLSRGVMLSVDRGGQRTFAILKSRVGQDSVN